MERLLEAAHVVELPLLLRHAAIADGLPALAAQQAAYRHPELRISKQH